MHLGPAASTELAEEFLTKCVRKSGLMSHAPQLPEPIERVVNVRLGPQEWVLYQQALHERAGSLAQGHLQAYQEMLQLCSHFRLSRCQPSQEAGPERLRSSLLTKEDANTTKKQQ